MRQMDGLDLLAEIKQRWSDLPVMMVTAYGDDQRRRRASELGACECLTKPVDFDRLKAPTGTAAACRIRTFAASQSV
jgi:DNA-binding response OmpR family regulator